MREFFPSQLRSQNLIAMNIARRECPRSCPVLVWDSSSAVARDRHAPGDKLSDSWDPGAGARAAYLVLHMTESTQGIDDFPIAVTEMVFDYLKEALNVCRDLCKSHFSFHLAAGHSGFISLVIFCCICQYFFYVDLCVCHRSCTVYQNISGVLVWSCHLILEEGWNYLNGADPW